MASLRDVALILLALEGALFTLAAVAVLAAVNYGFIRSRWWHTLPRWFAILRGYLALIQGIAERLCRAAVAPILAAASARAALTGAVRRREHRHTTATGHQPSSPPVVDSQPDTRRLE